MRIHAFPVPSLLTLAITSILLSNWANVARADPPTEPKAVQTNSFVMPVAFEAPAEQVAIPLKELSAETLDSELARILSADLDEALKEESTQRLTKAKEWLEDARKWAKQREADETEIAAVPTRTTETQQLLAKPIEPVEPDVPRNATVAQLESQLDQMRHLVEAAEQDATEKQDTTEKHGNRLTAVAKELLSVEKRLSEAQEQLSGLTGSDLAANTKRLEQQARVRALTEHQSAIKVKRQLLEVTAELLPMERDLAIRTSTANQKQLQRWEDAVSKWRKKESIRQADQARKIAEQSHPALRSLAERNAEIAELRITAAAGIEKLANMNKQIKTSAARFTEQFNDLRGRVQHAGATTSTGILLRKHRGDLPEESEFAKRADFVEQEMPKVHLQLMEMKQARRELADPDEAAAKIMLTVEQSLAEYDHQQVLDVVKRLVSDRRDFLDKAIPDQNKYLQDLNELDLANKSLDDQVDEFRLYLDQRVLWMRSNEVFGRTDVSKATSGIATLITPSRWIEVLRVGGGDLIRQPSIGIGVIALFLLVLVFRARMFANQRELCRQPETDEPAVFLNYAAAFAITFVVSARWPLLLAAVGFRLMFASGTTAWTSSVGAACLTTVVFVWGCESIRELCRCGGVGESLFHWHQSVTASVRAVLEVTLLVGTPLFAMLQLSYFAHTPEMESLQRLLFITILMLCGMQIGWLARPGGKLMQNLLAHSPTALACRLRRPIWVMSTAAPIGFAILSVVGYHFSAYQLSGRLAETGAAIVAMIVLHSLALCWLEVQSHNRQLRELKTDQSPSETLLMDSPIANDDVRVESINPEIEEHEAATREFKDLLRYAAVIGLICGGWFIWSDVLPALRVLDRVELWQNIETVAETVTNQDGSTEIRMNETPVPTTLTDVLMAILICIGTVMLGRRLPGLLELTLLEKLPVDQGGRHAIAILVRYAATVAGLLLACHMIRLSWASVQWLAAAMTVGLGFGLQEIFANLVSGLIILFERPIRAGDLVTVGDLTGNVTRMQIRATTITDFDRREMIVPNKKFITDNVINWTLTDPVSRVVLPVGVAYGTDVDHAHRILIKIAEQSSLVMSEPAPTVLFKEFGDSTLNMQLRVFIPQRDLYVDVVNEINGAINREFAAADIEIAFPQQDLHIKSIESIAKIAPHRADEPRMASESA
ncbi:MAG: mechanosensitive ion channel domain-containing protein [Rubripirellula sp.]